MSANPFRSPVLVAAMFLGFFLPLARASEVPGKVNVILWFDTEDYILPASDDAALYLANFLSSQGVKATFKVVGEKARTLERRGRKEVIQALKKHDIGYHTNFHSVPPTPAQYLSDLGWDEGVAEFDRREGPGYADVKRIFAAIPSCYGQPGSSWGPQVYGAMRRWGMEVYLDAGNHVGLEGRPCFYCGILNLYQLAHTLRADLNHPADLPTAEERFRTARQKLKQEGGGIISIYYHPCEFVHKEFWDGVNFRHGANPPPGQWKVPPAKTSEESQKGYEVFEKYIRFIKGFDDVRFVTAREVAELYRDKARGRRFSCEELNSLGQGVGDAITFQKRNDYVLAASEVFALLNEYVAARSNGRELATVELKNTPLGPTSPVPMLRKTVTTDDSQFRRTASDVADFLLKQGRIPTSVWLGSVAVPPEAYLRALGEVTPLLLAGKPLPKRIAIKPARLAVATQVASDGPHLWGWVIFPRGLKAPAMMDLAQRQSWTLKPANR